MKPLVPLRPAALVALAALLAPPAAAQAPGNVLLIVADDLGIDQLASYGVGAQLPDTPNLDALAAGGVLFRNAWANPVCSPTRATIQTGRHGFRTGVGEPVDGTFALPLAEVTLPEMLDAATGGLFDHALIGKWHLGNTSVGGPLNPNLQGYAHFAGPLGNIPAGESYYQYTKVVNGVAQVSTTYATTDQVDDALAWIAGASEPWFCMLSLSAPHYPLEAPPPALSDVDLTGLSPHGAPKPFYNAMVEALDSELGRLFQQMDPAVHAATTVLFVGDNGSSSAGVVAPFDPLKAKWTLFEGGVRVPLLASGYRVAGAGREVDALVHTVDFFATVAELAGVDATAALPGGTVLDSRSLVPFLEDVPAPPERAFAFTEFFAPNGFAPQSTVHAVRSGRYKLIRDSQLAGDLFYDLLSDPFELQSLLEPSLAGPAGTLGLTQTQLGAYRRLQGQLASLLASAAPPP